MAKHEGLLLKIDSKGNISGYMQENNNKIPIENTTIKNELISFSEEDFEESYEFVKNIHFYETHIFKYSRRAGTKAAVMPDQIPEEIKSERSAKMIELGHRKQKAYEERLLGTTQEVLMEEAVETEDGIYKVGHTKEYVKIGLKTEENLSNQLKNVKIEDTKQIIH